MPSDSLTPALSSSATTGAPVSLAMRRVFRIFSAWALVMAPLAEAKS